MIAGIWDCLSSQDVVNFVRYQVSEGKELTEIGEMICDHCLAPDTNSWLGMGCVNMTLLIVAITHGRSKEEWIAYRVKNNYGYVTPSTLPQLYAQSRLMAFRANRNIIALSKRCMRHSVTHRHPLNLLHHPHCHPHQMIHQQVLQARMNRQSPNQNWA